MLSFLVRLMLSPPPLNIPPPDSIHPSYPTYFCPWGLAHHSLSVPFGSCQGRKTLLPSRLARAVAQDILTIAIHTAAILSAAIGTGAILSTAELPTILI